MKKFLLGSSALCLALGLSVAAVDNASAAQSKKPTLSISGQVLATYHLFDNGNNNGVAHEKGHGGHFEMADSFLAFMISGRMDQLLQTKYDWLVTLDGNTDKDNSAIVETNRLRLKGEWGTFMFGNHQGVENFMARGAFGVMGATGGFDGNLFTVLNCPTGVFTGTDLVGATKYATKATYVTPRVFGLQAGVSYTVNSEHRGEGKKSGPHNGTSKKTPGQPFSMNTWAAGVNFLHEFENGFGVALSATGITARTRTPSRRALDTTRTFSYDPTSFVTLNQTLNRERVESYALGAVFSFRGWELGLEYLDNGDSREIRDTRLFASNGFGTVGEFNAGEAYSVALSYTFGSDKVAAGYYHSERKYAGKDCDATIYSVTYDRKLAPGLSFFAEGNVAGMSTHEDAVNFDNTLYQADKGFAKGVHGNNAKHVALGFKFKF
ncbi:MAG: porin [Alphaproteobacteria bacterium]